MTPNPHGIGHGREMGHNSWDTKARQDMVGRGVASHSDPTVLSMHKSPVGPGGGGAACAKQSTQREENMKN